MPLEGLEPPTVSLGRNCSSIELQRLAGTSLAGATSGVLASERHVGCHSVVGMFAVAFDRFGPPEVLELKELPEPHAGPGEIRIRVVAAGVSPVDLSIRSGASPSSGSLVLPHIPGVDAAGVVDEVGEGVNDVAIDDEVFGTVAIARLGGATAEYAVLEFWAAKPATMSWSDAGAAGSGIETATRALDALGVREGSVLLVDGAAGGVGSIAVQLAIARGARVIGTGRADSLDFIEALGATAVEYGDGLAERVEALGVGAVDLALDTSGKGSLAELIAITGSPDNVLTIADFSAASLGVRISMGELAGQPHGKHGLAVAAQLSEQGRFRMPVQGEYPFSRASEAHRAAETGARRGKIVLIAGE